jgi:macrolide-specific efflux system membrane fusion protein
MSVFGAILTVAAALGPGATDRPGADKENADRITLDSVLVTLVQQVEVPAQEEGVIAKVAAREGQLVAEGDLLAQIDDTEAQLAKSRAAIELETARKKAENRIQIRYAEKAWEVACAELKRATDALARHPKSVSDTELDALRLESERAALAIEQAKFDFEVAQYDWRLCQQQCDVAVHKVERRRITAPIAGVVVAVNRHGGEWVERSEPVFRILRMDRLRAEGFLNSQDVPEDVVGRPVVLRAALPGNSAAQFSGTVVFVSPEVNPVNGQVRVWAEVENPDLSLHPGLRGSMTIEAASEPSPAAVAPGASHDGGNAGHDSGCGVGDKRRRGDPSLPR